MTSTFLQTEGTNPHADPRIQVCEDIGNICHTKVVGISSNDRIKVVEDSIDIPPLVATGHGSDTFFELLKGTRSDAKTVATKVKPEELETLAKIREASFRLMEGESERAEGLLGECHGKSGFLWRFGEDDKIIGVSDVPPTFGLDLLIEGVENNVGKQRRDDAPLGSTLSGDADDATITDTGFEEGLEKTDDATVCDPGTNAGYNNLVVNSVEEGGDIRVNNAAEAFLGIVNCGCYSVVSLATWPEAIASIREEGIEDRRQDLIDRLLAHAVDYNWNSQGALLLGVGRFRDVDAPDRLRYEAIFHELALKLSQVSFRILFKGADSHPIEPMGTLIGANPTPSGPEVVPIVNFIDKRMSFQHRSPLAYYTFATR
jgi:hypothetical protein